MKVLGWCSADNRVSDNFEYINIGAFSIALGPNTLCTARDRASAQIRICEHHFAFLPISPSFAVSLPEVQSWSERHKELISTALMELRDTVQVTAQIVTNTNAPPDTDDETWLRARANRRNVNLKRSSDAETYLRSSLLHLSTKGLWFRHKAETTIMDVTVMRSLAEVVKSRIEEVILKRDWGGSIVGPLPVYGASFQFIRQCKII